MITHVVIFWTDKPHTHAREQLQAGARDLLSGIPGMLEFRFGAPVPSARGVVDDSFCFALSMTFADEAAAEAYQKHPLHVQFVERCVKPHVKRFVVYDWA